MKTFGRTVAGVSVVRPPRCSAAGAKLATQDRPHHRAVRRRLDARHRSPLIADELGKKYPDSAFVVENKPGASGNLGTDAVAKAKPDGSTIGISIGGPLAINTLLFSKLPYDPQKDIAADHAAHHAAERAGGQPVARGQQRRRAGHAAEGQPGQIQFRLDRQRLAVASGDGGVRAQGRHQDRARALSESPQAITAVIRNDAQMACLPAISVTPLAADGKVKILAVSTAKRSPFLPDVPTLKESGIDVEADAWNGPDRAGRHAEGDHRQDQQGRGGDHQAAGGARQTGGAIDGAGRLRRRRNSAPASTARSRAGRR